jgi:hypothetical protein
MWPSITTSAGRSILSPRAKTAASGPPALHPEPLRPGRGYPSKQSPCAAGIPPSRAGGTFLSVSLSSGNALCPQAVTLGADTRRSRGLPQIAAVDPNGPCSWLSRFWAIVSNSATSRRLSDYRVAVQRVRGVDVECWRPFTAIHCGRGGSPAHCDDRSLDPVVDIRTVGTLDDVDTVSEDTDRQMGLRPALHDRGEQQRTDMPQRQSRRIGACFVADDRRFERRTL